MSFDPNRPPRQPYMQGGGGGPGGGMVRDLNIDKYIGYN
jgi:hypothetical protein